VYALIYFSKKGGESESKGKGVIDWLDGEIMLSMTTTYSELAWCE